MRCRVPGYAGERSDGEGPEGRSGRDEDAARACDGPSPGSRAPSRTLLPPLLAHPLLPLPPAGPAALTDPPHGSNPSAQLPQPLPRAPSLSPPPRPRPQLAPGQGPERCSVPWLRRRTRPRDAP